MHWKLFAVEYQRDLKYALLVKMLCLSRMFLGTPTRIFDNFIADFESLQQFARIYCTLGILRKTESNTRYSTS